MTRSATRSVRAHELKLSAPLSSAPTPRTGWRLCSTCRVHYEKGKSPGRADGCPLCEARLKIDELQMRVGNLERELDVARGSADTRATMRAALPLCLPQDLALLKGLVVAIRDRNAAVRVVYRDTVPVGFATDRNRAELVSPGGRLIVRAFAERALAFGNDSACLALRLVLAPLLGEGAGKEQL